MDFAFATEPSPGHANEDHIVVSAGFAIVLDGVTQLPDMTSGCHHGPRWLVRALGARLCTALSADGTVALADVLATAIEDVCGLHAGTCDLTDPNSPSATLAIVRERGEFVDYLVLCDSVVVFEDAAGITEITDDRLDYLPAYDRHTVARLRNQPDGFWVASTAPDAANAALTGTLRRSEVRRLLLGTDGVSRLVEFFGHSWSEVFDLVDHHGPRAAITAVRARELRHPDQLVRPGRRFKIHDDATIASWLR